MMLSDRDIRRAIDSGELVVTPFDPAMLQPAMSGYLLMETGHPYIQYFRDLSEARAFITRYPTMGDAVRAGRVHLHQIGETISPDWVDGTGVSADRGRQP